MWINRGVRGRDVCVHGANRICTRASLRFHGGGKEGCGVKEGEGEADMVEGEGGGERESKQNLHGNSVPVGRVELWVFNALLSSPLPFSQPPTLYPHLQPVPRTPSLSLSLPFPPPFTLLVSPSLSFSSSRFVSFPSLPCTTGKLLFLNSSIILPRLTW